MAGNTPRKSPERREQWYVVHQHHEVSVVQSDHAPSAAVEVGQRMKKVYGPFFTRAAAQELADDTYERTTKAAAERAGV